VLDERLNIVEEDSFVPDRNMHFLASSDLPYEAPQSSSSISLFEYGSNVLQAVEIRVVAFMPNLKNMLKKEEEERSNACAGWP
jgi:hypothetical protein